MRYGKDMRNVSFEFCNGKHHVVLNNQNVGDVKKCRNFALKNRFELLFSRFANATVALNKSPLHLFVISISIAALSVRLDAKVGL